MRPGSRCWSSVAARTSSSPTPGSPAPSCTPDASAASTPRTSPPAPAPSSTLRPASRGTPSSQRRSAVGRSGSRPCPGIPGLVGATPIQNVGAYGQEVSQTIARVRVYDREEHRVVTRATVDCHFGYRRSLFKAIPDRFVVLSVSFQFRLGTAVGAGALRRTRPRARQSHPAPAPRWSRCGRPSSSCVAARGWCSTPTTTTPGAPAASSPTRWSAQPSPPGCRRTRPATPSPTAR